MSESPGDPVESDPVARELSDDAISPDNPPDAKDGFQLLVEGATEYAVYALSPAGVVCTWNQGAERMKGYQSEEVIGKHFSMFFLEADRRAGVPQKLLDSALRDGKVVSDGWRLRKDGTRFRASAVLTALYDDTGRLRGFGKLVRDETDRREVEALAAAHAEQERIAVSLADTVVRRFFALGLLADGAIRVLPNVGEARSRLESMVQETDEAIRFLRDIIFDVRSSDGDPFRRQ